MDRWHGVTPAADVNNDGSVTAADLATIVLAIAGLDDSEQGINTMLADVNYDGAVNASDLSMVVNHLAGLPPE
jgi:Ca2+-binding EF-hand superfamily protein